MKKPEFTKIINDEIDNVLALREFLSDEEGGPSIGSADDAAAVDMSPYINTMRENIVKSVQVRLKFINKYLLCDGRRPKKKEMFIAFNSKKPVPNQPGPGLFLLPNENQEKDNISYPKLKALAKKKGKLEVLEEKLPEMVEEIVKSVSPKASFFGLSSSYKNYVLRLGAGGMVYAEYTLEKMNPCKYFAGLTNIKFYEKNQDNKNNDALAALRGLNNDRMQATVQKFIIEAAIRPHLAEIEKLLESIAFSKDVKAAPTAPADAAKGPSGKVAGAPKAAAGAPKAAAAAPTKGATGAPKAADVKRPKKTPIKLLSKPAQDWSNMQTKALQALANNAVPLAPGNIEKLDLLLQKAGLLKPPAKKESLSIIDKYILKEQVTVEPGNEPAPGTTQAVNIPAGEPSKNPDAVKLYNVEKSDRLLAIKAALLDFQKVNKLTQTGFYDEATHKKMFQVHQGAYKKDGVKAAPAAAPAAAKTGQQTQTEKNLRALIKLRDEAGESPTAAQNTRLEKLVDELDRVFGSTGGGVAEFLSTYDEIKDSSQKEAAIKRFLASAPSQTK